MNYRREIAIITFIFLVTLCISIIISKLDFTHCNEYSYCVDNIGGIFGQWMGILSLSIFPCSLLLFFTKEAVYKAWKKFAIVAVLILFVFIIATPQQCSGILGMCLDREIASFASALFFLIVSLSLIIIKSIQLAKKTGEEVKKKEEKKK